MPFFLFSLMQIVSVDGVLVRDLEHNHVVKMFQTKDRVELILLPLKFKGVSRRDCTVYGLFANILISPIKQDKYMYVCVFYLSNKKNTHSQVAMAFITHTKYSITSSCVLCI